MIYRFGRSVMRIALWFFFREIEMEGKANVPKTGPILILPNHVNALIDPLVMVINLERPISITAKNTLAEFPLLGFLMKIFHVIPIHRRQDAGAGSDPSKNVSSLGEIRRRLSEGAAVCMFPEGQSHSDPSLRPFKHGASRLALEYLAEGEGDPNLKIIPVGLHFEDKGRLRTKAWIRFGTPIEVKPWREANPEANHHDLTEVVEAGIRELTNNFENEYQSALIGWASEIMATQGAMPPRLGQEGLAYSERMHLLARLKAGYEKLIEERGAQIDELSGRVEAYRSELEDLGIRPAEVYLPMDPTRALIFVIREATLAVAGFPVAAWGILNHLFPWLIVRTAAKRLTKVHDAWMSNSLFPGLVVYPLFYCVQIVLAFVFLPGVWALAYAVALPISGVCAVLYSLRIGGMLRRSKTFFRLAGDQELKERLVESGRGIIEEIRELAALTPEI